MKRPLDEQIWQQNAIANRLQTIVLLLTMLTIVGLLGWILFGGNGLMITLVSMGLLLLINPSASPHWIMRWYHAKPITQAQAPGLYQQLANLCQQAQLPHVPQLYYLASPILNAFTVGSRHHPAIALSDGLLRQLNERELAGVLAHEISHIKHNDLWIMGLADLFSRITSAFALVGQILLLTSLPFVLLAQVQVNWLAIILLLCAPNLVALAQLGLSRTREYDADLSAAYLTSDPQSLASALAKISHQDRALLSQLLLPGQNNPAPSLLRSHPPTKQRIDRLMSLQLPTAKPIRTYHHIPIEQLTSTQPPHGRPRRRFNGLWY